MAAFDNLNRFSVVVVIDSEIDSRVAFSSTSPTVRGGLYSSEMGRTIPRVVVTSPDQFELWGKLDYPQLFEKQNFRDLRKQVSAIASGEQLPSPNNTLKWSLNDSDGSYSGAFVRVEGDIGRVILKENDTGKELSIEKSRLSPGSLTFMEMQRLKNAAESTRKHRESVLAALVAEDWENADGKKIRARFLSLEGTSLTIQKEGTSHRFTVPIESLSSKSQLRAREIAASLSLPE